MKKLIYLSLVILVMAYACQKGTKLPAVYTPTPYQLNVPKGFPPPYIPADNPLTVEGIRLGRMLYYDPILSTNGRSCSSCHNPGYSYSSPLFVAQSGVKTSVPAHINLAWDPEYFWDGSAPKMDLIGLADFGPEFFNTDMPLLFEKLKKHDKYPLLFKEAFNIDEISTLTNDQLQLKIVYAISQFMRTMISSQSKADKFFRHEANLTPEEMDGFQTFFTERGDCFHCHSYPLFTTNTFNNTGLDSMPTGADLGYYNVTKDETDKGKFSPPTLRNIEFTAPYMHDGRFATLEEVVEFYNSGVHWNAPNIDPLMTKPAKIYGLNLTVTQKANLVKFLKTFTDTAFLNNPNFRSPF